MYICDRLNSIHTHHSELFRTILFNFIRKFNWSVNDGYAVMQMIQQNAGFPIYLLHKYGFEFHSSRFYTDCLLQAYPKIPELIRLIDGEVDINSFHRCFQIRFFERFMQWFGLTTSTSKAFAYRDDLTNYKTTDVFNAVFQFDKEPRAI